MIEKEQFKTITVNRKAHHEYFVEDAIETGIVLMGTEVKSLRAGRVNIKDAYARVENGELWLYNSHIAKYDAGNRNNHEPDRSRKLLVHKKELISLITKGRQRGYTLIPLKLYFKKGIAKVELGLAKGKKQYDKRDVIIKRQVARDIEKVIKSELRKFK